MFRLGVSWRRISAAVAVLALLSAGALALAGPEGEIPVTTKSDEARTHFEQGRALLDSGKTNEARPHFQKALELDPDFAYAHLNLANVSNSLEEFKTGVEKAAGRAAGASEGEQLLIAIAETFLSNDADKRQELGQKLVAAYPKSPRAWLALAGAHASRNEIAQARDAMSKASELAPDFFLPYRNLGFSYLFSEPRDPVKALAAMQKVAELQPKSDQAFVDLGDAYRATAELEKARDAYSKATELDPKNALAAIKKGHINSFLGDYADARKDFEKSVELADKPQKPNYSNYRAFTHLHEDNPKAAVAELWEIAGKVDGMGLSESEANGVKIFTLTNLATVAQHESMADELEKAVSQLRELFLAQAKLVDRPNFVKAQKAAAAIWEGTLAAVKADYEAAVRKAEENKQLVADNDNPARFQGYHGLMGFIALKQGQHQKAVEHLRQANLNSQLAKFHLGLALEGAGQTDEARRVFQEIAGFNFNSVDFALLRREAMKKAGTKSS
jgi:tetratricopeptide (TPR) repeat protein